MADTYVRSSFRLLALFCRNISSHGRRERRRLRYSLLVHLVFHALHLYTLLDGCCCNGVCSSSRQHCPIALFVFSNILRIRRAARRTSSLSLKVLETLIDFSNHSVLAVPSALPTFWIFMYRLSPVTYFVAALLSSMISDTSATCSTSELVSFDAPAGHSCGDYLSDFQKQNGGQLVNPSADSGCQYCIIVSTTAVPARFEIAFEDRWWRWGVTLAYSFFNVGAALVLYWAFRVPKVKREREAAAATATHVQEK